MIGGIGLDQVTRMVKLFTQIPTLLRLSFYTLFVFENLKQGLKVVPLPRSGMTWNADFVKNTDHLAYFHPLLNAHVRTFQ